MKKGYTLVEVLAVIIVLSVIGLIAIPAVRTSVETSKQKAYNSQIEIIKNEAKKWAATNNELLPVDNSVYKLSIRTLISDGYINNTENGKLKDPRDETKNIDGCVYISYEELYNQYLYEYKEEC